MSMRKVRLFAVISLGSLSCLFLALQVMGPQRVTFRGHTSSVATVVASPDGKTLASVSGKDQTIKLWDARTRKERATLRGSEAVFSPDGKTLASACFPDGAIHLWDVGTGTTLATLHGHTDSICALAFSPDGKTLASGSSDKTIKFWDVATAKEQFTLQHPDWVLSVAFSPDGKTLASGSNDRTIRLWDMATGQERATLRRVRDAAIVGCGFVGCVAFSPDSQTLASGHWETVKLWDVPTGQSTATLEGRDDEDVQSIVFSPDGKTLASLDSYGTINLWDVASGRTTATWGKSYHEPRPRLFRLIRSALDDNPSLTDVFPGINEQHTVPLSVLFTPDGRLVAFGYDARDDTTVRMWQVAAVPSGRK
jgi:WD40 repeat protein